jgi:glycine/D-amino acid oxidase-like deaminating enzyme
VVNAAGVWAKEICGMIDVSVPIEPLRRYEHYFECQDAIEPLPYLNPRLSRRIRIGLFRQFLIAPGQVSGRPQMHDRL